ISCSNNLKQLGLACHAYHDVNEAFPRGNRGSWGNDHGSWMFVTLPYMEQDNLYKQVIAVRDPRFGGIDYNDPRWDMQAAGTARVLPKKPPYGRCPSDSFDRDNPAFSSYIGSQGPQCNDGPCNPRADPFNIHCNGRTGTFRNGIPAPIVPPTHPGYDPSYQ